MNKTPREAYRDLKPKFPDSLLAFGIGDMIEFVHSDAHDAARMLQIEVTRPNGYDIAVVHSSQFFEIKRRLELQGAKIVLISRVRKNGKVIFKPEQMDLREECILSQRQCACVGGGDKGQS